MGTDRHCLVGGVDLVVSFGLLVEIHVRLVVVVLQELIGKRYVEESSGLEVLCTKSGQGQLALDGVALVLKTAKPLPSSD